MCCVALTPISRRRSSWPSRSARAAIAVARSEQRLDRDEALAPEEEEEQDEDEEEEDNQDLVLADAPQSLLPSS